MGTRSRREGTCPRPHGGIAQAPRPLGLGEPQAGRRGSAHASPARGARSARQRARSRRGRRALTIRGSGRPGPCHAIVLPAACTAGASVGSRPPWDSAEERGLRRARPGWPVRGSPPMGSGERGAHGRASSWRCRGHCALPAPIAQRGSYLACVRVQAAVVPGFQEARLGPPQRASLPRMLPAALDAADCPSVSPRALPGRFPCWPPAGGAPTPSRPTPHSHLGKGCSFQVRTALVVVS